MEFASFQFKLIAIDELQLPPYKGSAFRGLFGHALKRTVCVTSMRSCDGCLLRQNCAYAYIFETFNNRGEHVAHPFVIEPPMKENKIFPPGDTLLVAMILMGKAINFIPYIIYAFREMGKRGIGYSRGKFYLKQVTKDGKIIYDFQEQLVHTDFTRDELLLGKAQQRSRVRLNFITPTAIKSNGRINGRFDFTALIKALKRRIKALSIYHNGKTGFEFEYDAAHIAGIKTKTDGIKPYSWRRYSNRQEKKIDFSGYIGSMEVEGDLTPYMPLLKAGEIVHVGRGTVYGMGKYQIEEFENI